MGHERVGALPQTRRWRDVVSQIAASSGPETDVAALAKSTLDNVRNQFRRLHRDDGVISAFQFLVALSKAASPETGRLPNLSIDLSANPPTLRLVAELRLWVDTHQQSTEYADVAKKAAADTIAIWTDQQQQQPALFPHEGDSLEVWRRANSGAGFCEVGRLFFSKFTERYLNYFLGREASAVLSDAGERDRLALQLRNHIDGVSKFDSLVKPRFEEVPAL